MTFSLSRRAREAAETSLTNEALGRFQEKARAIAKTLNFPNYALGQITVRTDAPVVHAPMYRAATMAAGDALPPPPGPVPVEAGKSAVTVFVSGSVILGPAK